MKNQKTADFLRFMEEYADFFDRVTGMEREKRAALLSNKLDKVRDSLTQQQAVVMQIGNLEKRRVAAQAAAGFDGLTFREIAGRLEGEERETCLSLLGRLEERIGAVKLSNQKSMEIAKDKSAFFSNLLMEAGYTPAENLSPYSPKGGNGGGPKPVKKQTFDSKI